MPNGVPMAWMVGSYHHLPLWVADDKGAHLTDVDGFTYADFNIADLSMFCGYGPEPLVRAVSARIARGNQFLLPSEDSIVGAGPVCSVPCGDEDVDAYLEAWDALLETLVA
jgi:glutamate-1-semialdehyde 2,1-aminomutase